MRKLTQEKFKKCFTDPFFVFNCIQVLEFVEFAVTCTKNLYGGDQSKNFHLPKNRLCVVISTTAHIQSAHAGYSQAMSDLVGGAHIFAPSSEQLRSRSHWGSTVTVVRSLTIHWQHYGMLSHTPFVKQTYYNTVCCKTTAAMCKFRNKRR